MPDNDLLKTVSAGQSLQCIAEEQIVVSPQETLVCEQDNYFHSQSSKEPKNIIYLDTLNDKYPVWAVLGAFGGFGDGYVIQLAAQEEMARTTRTKPGLQVINSGGIGIEVCGFAEGNAKIGQLVFSPTQMFEVSDTMSERMGGINEIRTALELAEQGVPKTTIDKSTFVSARRMPILLDNNVLCSSRTAFATTSAGGFFGGALAILFIEDRERRTGRHLPWYGEPLVFIGSGMATQSAIVLLSGESLTASSALYSIPHGIPASAVGFYSVSQYGSMVGINPHSNEGRWFTVTGASLLVGAALTAKVGGASAIGYGLTALGVGFGVGSTAGAGLALLVGGLLGTGLDYAIGAMGVCSQTRECSLSGWLSDKMMGR